MKFLQLPNDKVSRELPEVAALWDADQLHLSPEGSRVLGQFVLQCMRKRQSIITGTGGTDVATAAATATGSNQPAAGTVVVTTGTATATTGAVDELKPRIEPMAPRDSAKRFSCILM